MKRVQLPRRIQQLLARIPEAPAFLLVALAVVWCLSLFGARVRISGTLQYLYLPYNISLALIPLVLGAIATHISRRALAVAVLAVWLLFFPNAPYLLTDLIHLRPRTDAPFWFDWAYLVSCAGTGLLIALVSLHQIYAWLHAWLGRIRAELCLLVILALTGFGIYLGRFPRWNTWDIAAQPLSFASEIADLLLNPLDHPRMLAYSFSVTFMLAISWFGFRLGGVAQRSHFLDS